MAKGNRLHIMSGKLGNEVLTKISNSSNKVKQGTRVYVAEISNPKTRAQVLQRMKMTPLVNFYRAFGQEVLDHSFQGVKYGGRSHSKFMQLNMARDLDKFPYVAKGTTKVIPGEFIVATGGMPTIVVEPQDNSPIIKSSLVIPATLATGDSVKAAIDKLLAANPFLKRGDQITIMSLYLRMMSYTDRVERLILDESKYTDFATWGDVLDANHIRMTSAGIQVTPGSEVVGAAIILSRPQLSKTSGSVSWLRSNATFVWAPKYKDAWHSDEYYAEAIQSYLSSAASTDSDWYLNQGTTE